MNSSDKPFPKVAPPQTQTNQPGIESLMDPKPVYEHPDYQVQGKKLKDKVAIVTGGDSGIGRAVAIAFAKEGARVAVVHYANEYDDAAEVKKFIENFGSECLLLEGDLARPQFADEIVKRVIEQYKQINILVNNAAVQFPQKSISQIKDAELLHTFNVNFFGTFYLTRAIVPHMTCGDSIINTTSVVAFEGNETLLDYTATKGALTSFTYALAKQLAPKGIRVNAVAPGPIWTPLIPASFDAQRVAAHGTNTPIGRMGQPVECVGAYVLLASNDASYMTGTTLHVNGGTITT